jgi:hypothetical protein
MYSAPDPAPDPAPLLIRDSYSPGIDSRSRPLLNLLILRRFIDTCLVTFWLPIRHLIGDQQVSVRWQQGICLSPNIDQTDTFKVSIS